MFDSMRHPDPRRFLVLAISTVLADLDAGPPKHLL